MQLSFMVQYTLKLQTDPQSNGNDDVSHHLDLNTEEENQPERLFNRAEFREELRLILQQKTACSINDVHLEKIVKTWVEDIQEGYRSTRLTLDLPPIEFEKINRLQDPGERSIPDLFPPDFSQISPQGGAFPPLNFD
ncbi:hypothetical protein [Phormidium sp. CCY1219]|uniref:hypothetical protein n=1 Tax=Phormidium sp. CCY1219 TaxID=2886104 RepID=UPI002D1EC21D|nr:hypothetical protein [Phormidium sp. CCY1219]MEB3827025.1 hypothetical protein [Phormidium sp. CCY1219]